MTCSRCDVSSADLIIRNSFWRRGIQWVSRRPWQTMIRILFVFDPWRSAILLTSGDKTGQWNAWYERAIPHAEELYAVYLKERAVEESQ